MVGAAPRPFPNHGRRAPRRNLTHALDGEDEVILPFAELQTLFLARREQGRPQAGKRNMARALSGLGFSGMSAYRKASQAIRLSKGHTPILMFDASAVDTLRAP